ncbi:hypothetical protein [Auritidibacter ignavus]|uniref:hypothetical protein n=1 Tax=Auritidibacter ignavus TaxID=678932 RepID=UPI002FE5617A
MGESARNGQDPTEVVPFATVDELKDRWPDFPPGTEAFAATLLEDATQFILDVAPNAVYVSAGTRRRVVCAVVRRAMEAYEADTGGGESLQFGTGPFQFTSKPNNPHGDFYLTRLEKKALGEGAGGAFTMSLTGGGTCPEHRPWCNLRLGATWCSCGADIAGKPVYEP